MATSTGREPLINFRFAVTGDGVNGCFSKVTGLKGNLNTEDYRCGTDGLVPTKVRMTMEFDNVTFERGIQEAGSDIALWFHDCAGASPDFMQADVSPHKNLTIKVFARHSKDTIERRYTIQHALCVSYELGDLDANSGAVLVESCEVAHVGVDLVG